MPITLLVANAKELIRAGLLAMLDKTGVRIVGQALDVRSTLSLARKLKPTTVILDAAIPGTDDCFALVKKLLKSVPATNVIMLSTLENPTYMARARAVGASDFLFESLTAKELVTAIQNAAARKPSQRGGAFAQVAASMDAQPGLDTGAVKLTPRESQVLRHIAFGLSNDEISRSLAISVETVKEHVQNLLRKLALKDRTQAAVWAVKAKWV